MPPAGSTSLRFGAFEIDTHARVLRKSGVKIRLQEQPFEVLLALLESPGEIITREQLRQRLWPEGTFVEFDHALNTAVKKIRSALCDDAALPRYVETIPRRGYRFLAPVDRSDSTSTRLNVDSVVARAEPLIPKRSFSAPALGISLVIPMLVVCAWLISHAAAPKNVTLAVLPFSNMNPDSTDEAAMANFPALLSWQLQRMHPAKLVIRDELSAQAHSLLHATQHSQIDYVLQGGLLGDKQHLHVAVQLIRLRDQKCIWEKEFDRDATNPEAQMEVTQEIVREMQRPLESLSSESR
jgi:DNA-binding winged helix-turn-helix (wHTH) protein/TolB-like protein